MAAAVGESWDDLYPWFHLYLGPRDEETDPLAKEALLSRLVVEFSLRKRLTLLGFDRIDDRLAVSTGFPNVDWRRHRFEVDYWVPRSKQGRGYAAEAVNGLVRYAFAVMNARAVSLGHADGNLASEAVARRLLFARTSRTDRGYAMPDGRLVDWHQYERTGIDTLPPLDVRWSS